MPEEEERRIKLEPFVQKGDVKGVSDDVPGSLMMADANFPRFTGSESAEQKITTIQNYLFQLTEQLRWAYANVGRENFNETEFSLISEEIAGPVVKKYESLDLTVTGGEENSNSCRIQITGDGLKTEAKIIEFKGMVTFSALETSGKTTINGDNIKTGTISAINMVGNTITGGSITGTEISGGTITGSLYRCILNGDVDEPTGEIKMYYADNGKSYLAGGLRVEYDESVPGSSSTKSRYRIRLYSNSTGTSKKFSLKLESEHRMSLEANELIYMYVKYGGQITLEGPRINLNGSVYINDVLYEPPTITA